jgi:sugar phosphate isomerase/epimerase
MTAATLLTRRLGFAADDRKIEKIGLQLYTVRDLMKQDFDGTLAKVAAVGYKEVEFAGYFDHSPKDVRAAVDRHGLAAPAAHIDYKSLGEKFPEVIEAAKVVGHEYLVNPWIDEEIRKQPDGWKHAAETFNRAGEACKNAGIQFAYHNHWFEFLPVNGKLPYDLLLTECDPNLVKMELDLCWITVGGQDPLRYFERYPGRFPLVHVKDVKRVPPVTAGGAQDFGSSMKDMTEVGSGIIDWKKIFAQADKAGIKHYFVEHDNPKKPLESIKKSYDYLARLRFQKLSLETSCRAKASLPAYFRETIDGASKPFSEGI